MTLHRAIASRFAIDRQQTSLSMAVAPGPVNKEACSSISLWSIHSLLI